MLPETLPSAPECMLKVAAPVSARFSIEVQLNVPVLPVFAPVRL